MLNGELVSRVINGANVLNKDMHLSRRYVIGIAKQKAATYISQKWADGTLFGEMDLFSRITCFEMEQISAIRCPFVELKNCRILMRSRKTLPKLAWSRYGASVLSVTGLDDQLAFYPTTLLKSSVQSKRAFGHVKQYVYYVLDDYLYIPDVYIEAVNVVALALDRDEVECRKGCGCTGQCKSYWEYEFVCPDKLSEFVIRETLQEVLGGRMQIPVDENPNMDSNQKTRTGQ